MCLYLLIITTAVYSPVRHNEFIDYDDPAYVTTNPHVQAGLNWDTVVWAFTTNDQDNWHPLTWLSHVLDCQLFGLDPVPPHLESVCFHALNAILLFLILQAVTGRKGSSLLVAALFALHPFNVDSVAWVAERKNLLSTLFFLLSLGAYGWYARKPGWRRYIPVCLLFALSLLSKPMMVTFPFVLLLLDYWPLQRIEAWGPPSEHFPVPQLPWQRLVKEKLPLLALSAASSMVTIVAQRKAMQPLGAMPLEARVESAFASYFLYIWKTFWPSAFGVHYPNPFSDVPISSAALGMFAAGVVLLSIVSWVAWQQRHIRPYLIVGWLWYLGTLVPVIGIIQVGAQGIADRYAYVPLIGVFVATIWAAAELSDHFRVNFAFRFVAAALVIAALSFLTVRQIGYWRTSYSLWTHTLEVTGHNNSRADDFIGYQLINQRRIAEARPYFEEAARIDPDDIDSHVALAGIHQDGGQLHEAIKDYEVVVHRSLEPGKLVWCYMSLSMIFGELGDFSRAHEAFSRAQAKDPEITAAKLQELKNMVVQDPTDEGYLRLGIVEEQAGFIDDARTAYQYALQANPGRNDARRALDHLLSKAHGQP